MRRDEVPDTLRRRAAQPPDRARDGCGSRDRARDRGLCPEQPAPRGQDARGASGPRPGAGRRRGRRGRGPPAHGAGGGERHRRAPPRPGCPACRTARDPSRAPRPGLRRRARRRGPLGHGDAVRRAGATRRGPGAAGHRRAVAARRPGRARDARAQRSVRPPARRDGRGDEPAAARAGRMTPLEAEQATLAGEHAAVYLFGVLGAQASESRQPDLYARLLDAFHTHRRRRDQLTVTIAGSGADPVPAEVSYDLPAAMSTAAELNDAALQVERRIARTYGQLIESTAGAERRWALVALDDSAVRQLEFRGTPEMFPGTD
ncbi:DUF4439 domain-containing protein [Nocardioides pocheonensis]|uniref:DUF4439 domain-containing protein n=2 Tax=Nocardioides pocheonensis TaxID=661485 RepID=A0A3N0GUN9_9ACTN|nr:DUF4439 domain-containing protein [Nocardioides pocheonensis]